MCRLAQNGQPFTITSAASSSAGLAPESLAAALGANFTSQTGMALATPWPTMLGGVTIQVTDSAGIFRPAGLIYISPTQINFQIPAGTATGNATVSINNGGPIPVQIQPVAPALFSVNSRGVAAATAVAIAIPSTSQFPVPVFQCGNTADSCTLAY